MIAAQVVDAGAGLRVKFGRVTADRLGTALDTVLHDPAHRAAAARSHRLPRGRRRPAAAAHLERLATESR
ncbi:hypothetical protein GPN2_13032 [Streptomyces murinus]